MPWQLFKTLSRCGGFVLLTFSSYNTESFLSQCYSRKGIWWPLESSKHHLVSVSLMLLDCWSSSKSVLCNIETYCPCWTSVVWRLLLCERSPWWACLSSGWVAALMCWTHYFWPPVCPGATSEWKIKRNEGGGAGWKWKREQDGSLWDSSRFCHEVTPYV